MRMNRAGKGEKGALGEQLTGLAGAGQKEIQRASLATIGGRFSDPSEDVTSRATGRSK